MQIVGFPMRWLKSFVRTMEKLFSCRNFEQFVLIGTADIWKIGQQINFKWPKPFLNRNFALAREVNHDHDLENGYFREKKNITIMNLTIKIKN